MTGTGAVRIKDVNATAWLSVTPSGGGLMPGSAERQLRDAADRALRRPQGRLALVVHLSRLRPPAPRPHHGRIARAILQDTAVLHDGQVFALRNGDLVLLCRDDAQAGHDAGGSRTPSPQALPAILVRLLRLDVANPADLVSVWPLQGAAHTLLAYAADRLAESAALPDPAIDVAAGAPHLIDAMEAVLQRSEIADITQTQTAALLGSVATRPGMALRPLFREIGFSIPALEARIDGGGRAGADAYLFRHLAARLDRRMLDVLAGALGRGGALDAGHRGAPPLHLNLALPTLLGAPFAVFARACRAVGHRLGVEVSLVEASADPSGFVRARHEAATLGATLVLDGVSHLALLLARPWALGPDILKLDWSPRLLDLAGQERAAMAAAVRAIGPARIVLHRAEDEAAISWGRRHGIRRFQGRHVDAMLAAGRIVACPVSAACTLRQCQERAAATGEAGRRFCGNPALLDAGAP